MGLQVFTEKVLVWDQTQNMMVSQTSVSVAMVGNKDSIYAIEGPLICQTGSDICEAARVLKERLINHLPQSDTNEPDDIMI